MRLRLIRKPSASFRITITQTETACARDRLERALVIFIIYALFDMWALEAQLSSVSVLLRLLLVCPLILAIIWAMKRTWPYGRFMRLYSISFLVASVSVGAVIFAAQIMNLFLPYQGLLLMLLFGYFLMLMPPRLVTPLGVGIQPDLFGHCVSAFQRFAEL